MSCWFLSEAAEETQLEPFGKSEQLPPDYGFLWSVRPLCLGLFLHISPFFRHCSCVLILCLCLSVCLSVCFYLSVSLSLTHTYLFSSVFPFSPKMLSMLHHISVPPACCQLVVRGCQCGGAGLWIWWDRWAANSMLGNVDYLLANPAASITQSGQCGSRTHVGNVTLTFFGGFRQRISIHIWISCSHFRFHLHLVESPVVFAFIATISIAEKHFRTPQKLLDGYPSWTWYSGKRALI